MKALGALCAILTLLIATPAYANSRNTPDGPDEGHSIQVYIGKRLAKTPGFADSVRAWNQVPGPRLQRVYSKARAEIVAIKGPCTNNGVRVYGGTAKYVNGRARLCISAKNIKGEVWPERWIRAIGEHEFGHFFGLPDMGCLDPNSIMNECRRRFHLTPYDRAWKRGYVDYYAKAQEG